ncbi:MAG: PemK family transcriptional regulator [Anaerolineaceae bacterium]|nr:PemK family transcriptional regulator [Anaerolineaceae bacterium]
MENAISPGDIYWLMPQEENAIAHPQVVIAVETSSEGVTVTLCALTTNMRKLNMPGNVLLDEGEGRLPKRSIIEVGKVQTVAVNDLGDTIGRLSSQRIDQIWAGIRFIETSFLNK